MKKLLIAILFLAFAQTSVAQNDAYRENVKHYLTINGTQLQYETAIDGMFTMLKNRFVDYKIPAAVWTELESVKGKEVEDVKTILVAAYQAYFSMDDIKNMITFYESAEGKQMIKDPSKLTDAQQQKARTFFGSATGQKMIASRDGLAKTEGEISMQWSGELYKNVINKLAEKGYSIN